MTYVSTALESECITLSATAKGEDEEDEELKKDISFYLHLSAP